VVMAMESGTKQVEDGVRTTAQAGDSLGEIIGMNDQVRDMITQIATATIEQSSATDEVTSNIGEIAHLASESAEAAHGSAKACDELSALARDLERIVGQFQLRNSAHLSNRHTRHNGAATLSASPGQDERSGEAEGMAAGR
jgi:methyl-accepting chemotaxis protein